MPLRIGVAVLLAAGVVAGCALIVRRRWIVITVRGDSMLPELVDGQRILARRWRGAPPLRRRDIVAFARPDGGGDEWLVKRLVALPGDPTLTDVPGPRAVPAGSIVVLSDNGGYDSRSFGPLPRAAVRAVLVRPLS